MNLNAAQVDALKELINIGVGQAAGLLNEMLHAHIQLQAPRIEVLSRETIRQHPEFLVATQVSAVKMNFQGSFTGSAALVFPPASAATLVNLMVEEANETDWDALRRSTLTEIGNILINSVVGSISNLLKQRLTYQLPLYSETALSYILGVDTLPDSHTLIIAHTHFTVVNRQVDGKIFLVFEASSLSTLLDMLLASES